MIPHWSEVMPVIPLAPSVPLRGDDGYRTIVVSVQPDGGAHTSDGGGWTPHDQSAIRVDLDDPQGFAYALRYLAKEAGLYESHSREVGSSVDAVANDWDNIMGAHIAGATSDADRWHVAKALAEVTA